MRLGLTFVFLALSGCVMVSKHERPSSWPPSIAAFQPTEFAADYVDSEFTLQRLFFRKAPFRISQAEFYRFSTVSGAGARLRVDAMGGGKILGTTEASFSFESGSIVMKHDKFVNEDGVIGKEMGLWVLSLTKDGDLVLNYKGSNKGTTWMVPVVEVEDLWYLIRRNRPNQIPEPKPDGVADR